MYAVCGATVTALQRELGMGTHGPWPLTAKAVPAHLILIGNEVCHVHFL